jgi:hypothetical protein
VITDRSTDGRVQRTPVRSSRYSCMAGAQHLLSVHVRAHARSGRHVPRDPRGSATSSRPGLVLPRSSQAATAGRCPDGWRRSGARPSVAVRSRGGRPAPEVVGAADPGPPGHRRTPLATCARPPGHADVRSYLT